MLVEKTLVIIKPDAVQRSLVGKITKKFEDKGLKISGMKMIQLDEKILTDHYSHLKDKPFFKGIVNFMSSTPVIVLALEGKEAVTVVRQMAGPTNGREATPGTIRGDYSVSIQSNVIHASESVEAAKAELKRFFKKEEIFEYNKMDSNTIYSSDEK